MRRQRLQDISVSEDLDIFKYGRRYSECLDEPAHFVARRNGAGAAYDVVLCLDRKRSEARKRAGVLSERHRKTFGQFGEFPVGQAGNIRVFYPAVKRDVGHIFKRAFHLTYVPFRRKNASDVSFPHRPTPYSGKIYQPPPEAQKQAFHCIRHASARKRGRTPASFSGSRFCFA